MKVPIDVYIGKPFTTSGTVKLRYDMYESLVIPVTAPMKI
ncbi:hypothetical protein H477_5876 [[Clostridium] sordellii ATCC 9714]|nr:hypothetical protein H477_5876 [[Clostridium] sordellii ATCC 9714] [Paeniclostridium sordellii ATCC 9714]